MDAAAARKIRTLIAQGKRWDLVFAVCGFFALAICALAFAALFIDMVAEIGRAHV